MHLPSSFLCSFTTTRLIEKLLFNVESLVTLKKLDTIQGAAYFVIVKKLEILKSELVTYVAEDWRDWTFTQLLEALRKWTETNTAVRTDKRGSTNRSSTLSQARAFQSRELDASKCVYCDSNEHRTNNCNDVTSPTERKKILMQKKLCFNCAAGQHSANACKSKMSCRLCHKRHHTSICQTSEEPGLTTDVGKTTVVHPVVLVQINGRKFRALLDSGASHSYVSSTVTDLTHARAVGSNTRRIATLMGVTTTKVYEYDVCMKALKGNFALDTRVTRINKKELLTLDNPHNEKRVANYPHLRGVELEDCPMKDRLPVHIILGANEFAQIRTRVPLRVGRHGEPVAELTRFGWTIMAPGVEADLSAGLLAVNATADFEQLCALDVLGLADSPSGDQHEVYREFREQLTRDEQEGWYETGLPWKGGHPPLPNNRAGSLRRLTTQVTKLRRAGKVEEYDAIIKEQLAEGVVELAPDQPVGREFYMPHRAVIRETAESTKMRVVYDCSARAAAGVPSLNDCLHPGPALQNKLWNVLVRGRFHPVAVAGDVRKAFLQVRVREGERDALRFHWLRELNSTDVQTLRFTRVLFGLASSPFLLGGVLEQHLESWKDRLPGNVAEIQRSLYVDDLITGAPTVEEARNLKSDAISIFADGGFQLHKWHSNEPELEANSQTPTNNADAETTYAKLQFSSTPPNGCKLLGLGWDKAADTLSVTIPSEGAVTTKRGILAKIARIYDPLGIVSPVTLQGKFLYREACELKQSWDDPLPRTLASNWEKWERALPGHVMTRRSLARYQEPIDAVELHTFGDASGRGVAAAVYAVVHQASGTTQGLVAAKARLAKQGLTIPRLELVAGHMAANLTNNVRGALEGFPVSTTVCWLDSTVALHWIRGNGEYRQFVANRVQKIKACEIAEWRYVPTDQNPADLGSRGGEVTSDLWWDGPSWLRYRDAWPANPVTAASPESTAEAKIIREAMAMTTVHNEVDEFDELLDRHDLRKTLRVGAWITRFTRNCRLGTEKLVGPLTTEELKYQTTWWVQRVQARAMNAPKFTADRLQLNLQVNAEGVLECRGRIQGSYPAYLPDDCPFTEKLVRRAHVTTLHGGVGLTMACVREKYWVPRLRQLVKRVVKSCWGCKRFQAVAFAAPPPGQLPKERTEGSTAFEVIGVDFAGPIRYRKTPKVEGKAYLVLFACSLSRALHLEVLPNLETVTFLASLKRLVARRGRPSKIYSDNGKTFVGAAKWLKQIRSDERLQAYIADEDISWQFNLSRAPWWGGQFERLVGLFKRAFFKSIGGSTLTWAELCEVVLDVETQLNRRPLSYVEEDVQLPILTPAAFLFQRSNRLPEREPWREEDADLRKRAKYLQTCKDALWRRWTREYLTALRERHRGNHENKTVSLKIGDVVIVRSEERSRGKWTLGVVTELFEGRDGVVRAARVRTGKTHLERAVQHLYPLELSCDKPNQSDDPPNLSPEATVFRPRRDAAVAAGLRIQDAVQDVDQ